VRALSTYLLVGLLLACPVLCRASDDGCCADQEATSGPTDEHRAPPPSDEAASCICGGAVKAADHRTQGPGPYSLSQSPSPFLSDCIWPHPFSLALRHNRGGSPPEEVGWQGPRPIHALFQHFRC
jgi:hypothetical protein